jgi:hypothetical protein
VSAFDFLLSLFGWGEGWGGLKVGGGRCFCFSARLVRCAVCKVRS